MFDEKRTNSRDCELCIRTAKGLRYVGIYPKDSIIISKLPLDSLKAALSDDELQTVMTFIDMYDLTDGEPYYKDHEDEQLVAIIDAVLQNNI